MFWQCPVLDIHADATQARQHAAGRRADQLTGLRNVHDRVESARLLIPAKSNHIVADWISRGYFSQLLDSGVTLLRYREAMVHAKTCTIDGTWSTVGTANVRRRVALTGFRTGAPGQRCDDQSCTTVRPALQPAAKEAA